MKKVLSLLLIFVFLNVHAFAISGGPRYGGDSVNVDLIGTYAGVLIPTDGDNSAIEATDGESINSMGIFTLGVPAAGPATGSFLAFSGGIMFSGTITGVGDPGKGTLNALISATYDYSLQTLNNAGELVSIPVSAQVNGVLKATVTSLKLNYSSVQSLLSALQRIEGTADMAVNLGFVNSDGSPVIDKIINFTVDGVKQSNTVVAATLSADTNE